MAGGRTIEALKQAGWHDQVNVIVGGVPLTQHVADKVGANGCATDAGSASRMAKALPGLA